MALVVPPRGRAPETAKLLLDLADSQWDVKTTTEYGGDLGIAFLVPDDLHDRYLEAIGQGKDEGEAPAPKRRGRPRRAAPVVEDTEPDDEESEEE